MVLDFLSIDFTTAEPPGKSVVTVMRAIAVRSGTAKIDQSTQMEDKNFIDLLGSQFASARCNRIGCWTASSQGAVPVPRGFGHCQYKAEPASIPWHRDTTWFLVRVCWLFSAGQRAV